MEKKQSVYIIIGILTLTFLLYWFLGASNPYILAFGMLALCVFLLGDTIYDYRKRRPEGFRKKLQVFLTVTGCAALIAVLLYFILFKGLT